MKKIGFIGAGNMAYAISKAIKTKIFVFDKFPEQIAKFTSKNVSSLNTIDEIITNSDIIFLSVKPQNFPEVLDEIKKFKYQDKLFVTIAAGITMGFIQNYLPNSKIIRVMPNTPLLIGEGATALCKNSLVIDKEFDEIVEIFDSSGVTAIINEDKMNEIIAINGSSPAYIYFIADIVTKYGENVGIDKNTALRLFAQTLIGSGKMLLQSEDPPEILTKKVCSPGGTTLKAIETFQEKNLQDIFFQAMDNCVKRAYELSK